jgi:hypothetical protein
MALEGTLRDFSLADIFQLIGLQRKTGVLTLRGKDDTVTVTFLDGKVVGADSLNRRLENRLGTVLMKTGLLSQDQLNRALDIQKETLQRLGFILTHCRIISQSPSATQSAAMMQIVYRLFAGRTALPLLAETTIDTTAITSSRSAPVDPGGRRADDRRVADHRKRVARTTWSFAKLTDQEIVVVGAGEADEIDFDGDADAGRRGGLSDKIHRRKRSRSTTSSTAR